MSTIPPRFPLPPIDRAGNTVREGEAVKILEIPDWLVHDLPEQEVAAVQACTGTEMIVNEIDSYGYF